jgi:protein phosphatase
VAFLSQFRWTSASSSHVGLVRTLNEDACLDRPESGLWAVADGMGGHALGDFASHLVVDNLSNIEVASRIAEVVSRVRLRLQAVNRQLREEAVVRDAGIIGSTVVVLIAGEYSCGYLWAGDSRLYLFRQGSLQQLTRDHTQLEELRLRGDLPPPDSAGYPSRNMITRAVGALDELDLDEKIMPLDDGDTFLLCSDGLSNEVTESEIRDALLTGNCRQAVETLIEIALKRGGRDNISAVVVRADDLDSTDRTILNPAL